MWLIWSRGRRFRGKAKGVRDRNAPGLAIWSFKYTSSGSRGNSGDAGRASNASRLQKSALVSGDGRGKLIVGFDERKESVLIGRWIIGMNVSLDRSRSGLTSFDEFFDKFVSKEVRGRCRLHNLKEKFAGSPGFLDPLG